MSYSTFHPYATLQGRTKKNTHKLYCRECRNRRAYDMAGRQFVFGDTAQSDGAIIAGLIANRENLLREVNAEKNGGARPQELGLE
jgi:hypothetical protein